MTHQVTLLIDTKVTHDFISKNFVQFLQIMITSTPEYYVTIGTREKVKNMGTYYRITQKNMGTCYYH